MKHHKAEGRTHRLSNWLIDHEPAGSEPDWNEAGEMIESHYPEMWAVWHYVGGEAYGECFNTYTHQLEAEYWQDYLNTTMPPRPYTHYFDVEV